MAHGVLNGMRALRGYINTFYRLGKNTTHQATAFN